MIPDRWTDTAWKIAAWVAGYYFLAFTATQIIGRCFLGDWFQTESALRFDAAHYAAIAQDGYVPFRQAFFPLLPLVWRTLGLGVGGICLLNGLIYMASTTWLAWRLRLNLKALFLFLTLPSSFFFFVPYTESLFFAFSSLIIIGMADRSTWKILLGLFLCSLTRPTFSTLLPAIVLAVWWYNPTTTRKAAVVAMCVLTCAAGLFLVASLEHADTGEWYGFYTAQKGWGNEVKWPTLPFGSWGGDDVVRLDAVALLFGLASLYILTRSIVARKPIASANPSILLVSLGSLAFVTVLVVVLRGGQLFSLNRFVLCTPFFLILLTSTVERNTVFGWKPFVAITLALQAYFALFGSFVHIQNWLMFSLVVGYLLLALVATSKGGQRDRWSFPMLIILAFSIQISMAVKFLSGGWVA